MSERKPCIRCERGIDAWARLCPYCNWNQSQPAPPADAAPRLIETNYVPEDDIKEQIKRKGLFAGAGLLVLVAAFLIGMMINSDGAPDEAPEPLTEQAAQQNKKVPPVKRADTPLVPTNERGGLEQPITSAPGAAQPEGVPSGYDRSDATAVSSVEYTDLAKRAKAEKERMSVLVDPRSLGGAAYAQGQRPAPQPRTASQVAQQQPVPLPGMPPILGGEAQPPSSPQQKEASRVADAPRARRNSIRTRPVPQYQPLPRIPSSGTARLTLMIGPDGRVRDVNIERALSRNTADLVAYVQRWRFKPATENGEPISAPYSVDISFR